MTTTEYDDDQLNESLKVRKDFLVIKKKDFF
jgi:hypothetical protein